MDEELEELEMKVLRQKALSTMPAKMKGYREPHKLISAFRDDKHTSKEARQSRSREPRHHHDKDHSTPDHEHRSTGVGNKLRKERVKKRSARKTSSSTSTSRSRSASYSTYSSSASSSSISRSRSTSLASQSSYSRSSSSYSRSSYSTSHHSYSPQFKRERKEYSLHKSLHTNPSPRDSRLRGSSLRGASSHHHPHPPPHWYDEEHFPCVDSRSPHSRPRNSRGAAHDIHGARHYRDDYPPPPKRRPPPDFSPPPYRRRPPPERHSRMHSPPPPPPPALLRKERIVRHMHRDHPHRDVFDDRRPLGRGPPLPPLPPPRPIRRTRRPSPSPHRPPLHRLSSKRDTHISDRLPSHQPSRDMRSLCGQPIRVRERGHYRSPERRPLKPTPKLSSMRVPTGMRPTGIRRKETTHAEDGRKKAAMPAKNKKAEDIARESRWQDSDKRTVADAQVKEGTSQQVSSKLNSSVVVEREEKTKSPTGHQSEPPSAQLLWEDGEEEEELDYDETMEDLDLHPTGTIDDIEGEEGRISRPVSGTSLDTKPGTMSWDDSEAGEGEEERSKKQGKNSLFQERTHPDSDREAKVEIKTERQDSYEEQDVTNISGMEDGHEEHISSPIRVSPEREKQRVVKRSSHKSSKESRLSAKERLYVSKNTIEEKKRLMSYHRDEPPSRLRPSLANRLGPSPRLHGSVCRSGRSKHKGNAFAIAEEYKRRKQEEVSPREASRASMLAKRINEPEKRSSQRTFKRLEERSEENERALDQRIDTIKQRNKAIEMRHKEIEKDKELHG